LIQPFSLKGEELILKPRRCLRRFSCRLEECPIA
jgi:hypothetical protein